MIAGRGSMRLRRALISLVVLAALYGVAAEIGSRVLPRRVWMVAHYVEGVELLPPYSSLAEEASFLIRSGILPASLLASGARVLAGVLLGALVGIPLGLGMAWAARFEYLAEPWIAFFRFTPAFALLPLFVLWFGFGELSKILLIASGVAIVTCEGAFEGARRVSRIYLDAAASLGAGAALVLRRLVIPAAVPAVLASLRIAVALAWVTLVVAELIKPTMPSLGYLLALAGAYPRVPTMLLAIITIGALVLASDALALEASRRGTRWMRRQERG
jgi:ABC-type nitrate/sulfonate/bicarbonate transport system permease component